MIQVVCWKWEKTEETFRYRETYTAGHVNAFAKMVGKHLHCPHEIVCITDNYDGIDPSIRIVPIWDDLKEYGMCYRRLKLFSKEMKEVIGNRFVSMDLDCVITGDITDLLRNEESFIIWQPRTKKTPYCGSMWLMDAGARSFVWDEFKEEDLFWLSDRGGGCPGKANRWVHKQAYDSGYVIGSDQAYISYKLYPKESVWTKSDGIYNFNEINKFHQDAKIIFFPGKHDPTHKNLYLKHPWIPKHYPTAERPERPSTNQVNCITFYWGPGPYDAEYVNKLFNMVDRHLSVPHKNICFTNIPEGIREGIEIRPLHNEWMKGNLKKAIQFDPANNFEGRVLSFDLDNIIIGSLDMFVEYEDEFIIQEAIHPKRKGMCAGNFMGFQGGYGKDIWEEINKNYNKYEKETNGSERFLYDRLIKRMKFWPKNYIVSYKTEVEPGKVSNWRDVRIVWYHGKGKPHEIDTWLTRNNWK
jgi:hypothetical protein